MAGTGHDHRFRRRQLVGVVRRQVSLGCRRTPQAFYRRSSQHQDCKRRLRTFLTLTLMIPTLTRIAQILNKAM